MTREIKYYHPTDSKIDLLDRMSRRKPTGGRIACLKKLPHGAEYNVDGVVSVIIDNSREGKPLSIQHYDPVTIQRTKSYLEEVLRAKLDEIPERNPDSQNL